MNRRIHIDMQVRLPRPPAADKTDKADMADGAALLAPRLKTYGSRELFDGLREVGIEHGGALYRLKITRQGKLILNK